MTRGPIPRPNRMTYAETIKQAAAVEDANRETMASAKAAVEAIRAWAADIRAILQPFVDAFPAGQFGPFYVQQPPALADIHPEPRRAPAPRTIH